MCSSDLDKDSKFDVKKLYQLIRRDTVSTHLNKFELYELISGYRIIKFDETFTVDDSLIAHTMKPRLKGFMIALKSFCKYGNTFTCSITKLLESMKCNTSTIWNRLVECEKLGYIERDKSTITVIIL